MSNIEFLVELGICVTAFVGVVWYVWRFTVYGE